MRPLELFCFCPRCSRPIEPGGNPLHCRVCHLTYFFNPTVAAAAFVFDAQGRVILIRRDKEPKKGLYTIPGGFLDICETAEAGLARELREEVGLEIDEIRYLCSEPNEYQFKDVTYPVCDLVFTARAMFPDEAAALDGAEDFQWASVAEIDPATLAFPSVRKGLEVLKSRLTI